MELLRHSEFLFSLRHFQFQFQFFFCFIFRSDVSNIIVVTSNVCYAVYKLTRWLRIADRIWELSSVCWSKPKTRKSKKLIWKYLVKWLRKLFKQFENRNVFGEKIRGTGVGTSQKYTKILGEKNFSKPRKENYLCILWYMCSMFTAHRLLFNVQCSVVSLLYEYWIWRQNSQFFNSYHNLPSSFFHIMPCHIRMCCKISWVKFPMRLPHGKMANGK